MLVRRTRAYPRLKIIVLGLQREKDGAALSERRVLHAWPPFGLQSRKPRTFPLTRHSLELSIFAVLDERSTCHARTYWGGLGAIGKVHQFCCWQRSPNRRVVQVGPV